MISVILYQPQIPPNTGNIIRLCANTGCQLNLIQPLGFELSEKTLRRAGLDYYRKVKIKLYNDLDNCLANFGSDEIYSFTSKGETTLFETKFNPNCALLFGSETSGLPSYSLRRTKQSHLVKIPMVKKSRCLNLSNAVAIGVYEAWRQHSLMNLS